MEDEICGLEMGASGYIRKPFHPKIVKIYIKNQVELKYAREKLTKLAIIDGLTGIANRRYFDDRLKREWSRARRQSKSLALAMADMDWFKRYNDYYGHQSGDECLRRVADVLTQTARRDSDLVARYRREDFVLILPMTQDADALNLSQRICTSLSDLRLPHALSDFGYVTVSIGVAVCYPSLQKSPESLVEKADKALYIAKERGRNQIALFVESDT